MKSAIRMLRAVQFAMLVSIVLYVVVGWGVASLSGQPNPGVYYVCSLVAITTIGVILVVRRTLVLQSEATLRTRSDDLRTLNRWRSGYILTYALSEGLALIGLVLQFLGFTLSQVAPFYIAGFVLMLFFRPHQPSNQLT